MHKTGYLKGLPKLGVIWDSKSFYVRTQDAEKASGCESGSVISANARTLQVYFWPSCTRDASKPPVDRVPPYLDHCSRALAEGYPN